MDFFAYNMSIFYNGHKNTVNFMNNVNKHNSKHKIDKAKIFLTMDFFAYNLSIFYNAHKNTKNLLNSFNNHYSKYTCYIIKIFFI